MRRKSAFVNGVVDDTDLVVHTLILWSVVRAPSLGFWMYDLHFCCFASVGARRGRFSSSM